MKSKIIHALLSIVIAFGLWVYVITVVSPESEETFYNIPVVLRNETVLNEKGLMVISDKSPTVNLRLKGNRTDLNDLKSSDITLIADLSRIDASGQMVLTYSISYPGTTLEVVSQDPKQISVTITERASKEVDVKVNYTGSTPKDYIADVDSAELDHQKVTVTGPKDVIEQITQAVINVDLEGKSQTISQSYRYTLCDKDGEPVDAALVQTNVSEIQLTLRIRQVKQIQLLLDILYGGGATAQNTLVKVDPQTIKVAGSEKLLQDLDSVIIGSINLAELLENTTLTFPINLGEGIENISGVNEVTVQIEFTGLVTKVLNITNITATGDEGAVIEVSPKTLTVTLRGSAEQIGQITEQDVSALVDCTGAEPGEHMIKAQIKVNEAFDTVGAVGTYPIYATVSGNG